MFLIVQVHAEWDFSLLLRSTYGWLAKARRTPRRDTTMGTRPRLSRRWISMANKIGFFICFGLASVIGAQTADQAWLGYGRIPRGGMAVPLQVRALGNGIVEQSAVREMNRALTANFPKVKTGDSLTARARGALSGDTILGT